MTRLPPDQYPHNRLTPGQLTPSQEGRRTALKLLTGGVASVVLPSAIAIAGHSAVKPGSCSAAALSPAEHPTTLSRALSGTLLKIEIITGKSTPEDTVLLSSTGDHPLMLRQFTPGLLAVGSRILDLNQVLSSGALSMDAGAVRSVLLPTLQLQSDLAMHDYLLADAAVQAIGDGAEILTLSALVDIAGLAVVYVPQPTSAAALT